MLPLSRVLLLLPLAVCLHGDDRPSWRSWTASDGLQETYSFSLTVNANGEVCIRHGTVPFLSVLDGYSIRKEPDPRDAHIQRMERANRSEERRVGKECRS